VLIVRIAVSLDEKHLERIDQATGALRLPRSRLLARVAEEFLSEEENRKLLERLNHVYGDPSTEEEELRRRRRSQHRRTTEGTW